MKKRLPFFLGAILGPIGVALSCWLYGRETFLESVKGLGVGCCVVFVYLLVNSKNSDSVVKDKPLPSEVSGERLKTSQSSRKVVVSNVVESVSSMVPEKTTESEPREVVAVVTPAVKETREKLLRLYSLIRVWQSKRGGRLPESLSSLDLNCGDANPPHRDAWGKRFIYETADGRFAIASSGQDMEFDTDDDLVVYSDEIDK